eukprot:gene3555-4059_t
MPRSFLIKKVNNKQESSQQNECMEICGDIMTNLKSGEKQDREDGSSVENSENNQDANECTEKWRGDHDGNYSFTKISQRKKRPNSTPSNFPPLSVGHEIQDTTTRPTKRARKDVSPPLAIIDIPFEHAKTPAAARESLSSSGGRTDADSDHLNDGELKTSSLDTPACWHYQNDRHNSMTSFHQRSMELAALDSVVMVNSSKPRLSVSSSPVRSLSPPSPRSSVSPYQALSPVPMCPPPPSPSHQSAYGKFHYPCHCCSYQESLYQRYYYQQHPPTFSSPAARFASREHDERYLPYHQPHQSVQQGDPCAGPSDDGVRIAAVQIHVPKNMGRKPVAVASERVTVGSAKERCNGVVGKNGRKQGKELVRILPKKDEHSEDNGKEFGRNNNNNNNNGNDGDIELDNGAVDPNDSAADVAEAAEEDGFQRIKNRSKNNNNNINKSRKFKCKFCGKIYVSLGALKMHIRTHTLPCKCNICGKAFSRPWLLQGHIRTHTGEKPYKCSLCQRAFADRSNLRAHLQTHSDVKKYSCQTCRKTFSRMSLLAKHEEAGCLVSY